jgi:hypothetical protein
MSISKKDFSNYIKNFQFQELFIDLGWNYVNREPHPVRIDDAMFHLKPISEKEGFHILLCSPNDKGEIPAYALRKKLESKVTRLYREHLIIFVNENATEQLWQWLVRKPNQPARLSDTRWIKDQSPDLLYQKASGLFFSLVEEDEITIVDVRDRVARNFDKNNERVTKTFYASFKKQHTRFLKFIEGIEKKTDKEWYTSLMLNRLMFCYFIQKKGFLDGDYNYLQNKLKACQEKKGENEFYNFYRDFLLALFHEGLGAPFQSESTEIELGNIPYLNGGLFDEHALERSYEIHIDDDAFESIFNFFDQWEWHLDTRHGATGKEINPDVIGYIFEKYINDRADMGAYYTKEDITDYISKNTILPYLFDETERHHADAFKPDGPIWKMLKNSGDTYIYDAVKHGLPKDEETEEVQKWKHSENWWESPVFDDLPDEMKAGLNPDQEDLVDIRSAWNTSAHEQVALPTEIWREVIERRRRYVEVRQNIENGEVTRINDLITYNLNIRQFVQDVVENIDDSKFILHFYKSMAGDGKNRHPVSVLDPTCGSGAFLFAGLNILEPLYETCLLRMRSYISEEDDLNSEDKQTFRNNYKFFREVLEEVQSEYHPNQEYFIYKSIILRNLYGVDIMREAVEIAKLRLFLKMVATVDVDTSKENLGLEPLPDIDFNIRAGNTLVGVGTEEEIDTLFDGFFDFDNTKEQVQEYCEIVSNAFNHYKQIQLTYGEDFESFKEAKRDLAERLANLRVKLDEMLKKRHYPGKKLEDWKESHQPFHWYAEFYDIIHDRGGFDVIIGNPPYVVYNDSNFDYKVVGFKTLDCKDLYAFIIERSIDIKNDRGTMGMIVPISIVSTEGFANLRKVISNNLRQVYYSSYAMRPGKLFDGVDKHLTIFIAENNSGKNKYVSKYYRWSSEERESLFPLLEYVSINESQILNDSIPKISTVLELDILDKLLNQKSVSYSMKKDSKYKLFHTRKLRYFLQFLNTAPKIYEEDGSLRVTSELKEINFETEEYKNAALSIYLSNLFFWYYIRYSDCRNLNKREVHSFPAELEKIDKRTLKELSNLGIKLTSELQENSYFQEANYKKYGKLKMQVFQPRESKKTNDEIDKTLADYYGFNSEELDCIINYDIKYRMGSELEDE